MTPDEEQNKRPTDESAKQTGDKSAAPTPSAAPDDVPDAGDSDPAPAVASTPKTDLPADIAPVGGKTDIDRDVIEITGGKKADDRVFPSHVVAFWRDAGHKRWFAKDDAFDREIRARFESLHHQAARGELDDWADEPEGALALLLLLDQFPRNLYRDSAHAFATDPLARRIAARAVERGFDRQAGEDMRVFFYMPFEHSEDLRDQHHAVALLAAMGDDDLIHWAELHADIIERFGRFPHRNACLGRLSTDAEARFLAEGGFSG